MKTLCLCLLLLPQPAEELDRERREAFFGALRAAQEGRAEEAARTLERLAEDDPQGAYAADSLSKAASLYEEELFRPQEALRLYRRLVEKYPGSRPASRARARAQFIESHLDRGAETLAEYLKIQRRATPESARQSAEAMLVLLEKNPGFSLEAEGRIWAASLFGRAGLTEKARQILWQLSEGADARYAAQALIEIAHQAVANGELGQARRAYRKLAGIDTRWREAAENGLKQVYLLAVKFYLPWASLVVFVAALVWLWWSLIKRLRSQPRPLPKGLPAEIWFYLAVAVPIMALSLLGSRHTTRSVLFLVLFSLLALLPNAWWWKSRPPSSWPRMLARCLGLTIGLLTGVVLAIIAGGYYPELWHTIEFGPEQ